MTPIVSPPVLLDPNTGERWVFAGMTDLGPAYAPQQPAMPLIDAAPKVMPWETVTATVITTGEGE